jgi:hypothetical protein
MLQWFSTLVDSLFAEGLAGLFGPFPTLVVLLGIASAIMLAIAWRNHRRDKLHRKELREFILPPVADMNDALDKLHWEMTHRYSGPNKDALNEVFGQRFEHAIRRPYQHLERLVKAEADLPDIEDALRKYLINYRTEPANLRRYMTLTGIKADEALFQKWLRADDQCFLAFRKLKGSSRRPSDRLADLYDAATEAINEPE